MSREKGTSKEKDQASKIIESEPLIDDSSTHEVIGSQRDYVKDSKDEDLCLETLEIDLDDIPTSSLVSELLEE
jgi:hypothetical protein